MATMGLSLSLTDIEEEVTLLGSISDKPSESDGFATKIQVFQTE